MGTGIKIRNVSVIITLFLLITCGFFLLRLNSIRSKIFIQSSNSKTSGVTNTNKTIADYFKDGTSFNLLLLGYGGGNHDGAYLTDSIIIAHIEPSPKKIVLISVPRDIWVKIPTNGDKGSYWKINAAYELGLDDKGYPNKKDQFKGDAGGGNLAKYVISAVAGLPIDRFIALDFSGFQKTIDVLGGIDVAVKTTFDDYEYPVDGKEDDLCGHQTSELPDLEKIATISATEAFPCRYQHIHFDQGINHLNGDQALEFVRSRHSLQDGTDFGRSRRQRNLITAVRQKMFAIGFITKVLPFIDSFQDDVRTDLSLDELKTFIEHANDLGKYQISNLALTDQNVLNQIMTEDGQDALITKDGLDNWDAIRSWIQNSLDTNKLVISPVVKVENGTNISGLAALAYNRLQDRDFNLLPPANSDQKTRVTIITIFNSHIDPKVIDDLKKEFGVQQILTGEPTDLSYDILVVLGDDYNLTQGKKLIN